MVRVLCILASARKNGYSATLLNSVIKGIKSVKNVDYELINLIDYLPINPCMSCWNCVRTEEHRCILDDSMGRMGKGELFQKIVKTNALFVSHPVYYGRPPAAVHLLFERFYPFMWSGELNGMPFASLSQAANNGGARSANKEMARWASTFNLKHIGGIPIHMVYFDEAIVKAQYLGKKIAEAAIMDVEDRRQITQEERYLGTLSNQWSRLESTIEDMTNGTYCYEDSHIEYALSHGTIKKSEAVDLLRKAGEELKLTLYYYRLKNIQKAAEHLVKMRSFWSPATIMEFFEDEIMKNR